MDSILPGLDYVHVYLDDFVSFSRTLDEHMDDIISVSTIIASYGLKLKISNCHFAQLQIKLF